MGDFFFFNLSKNIQVGFLTGSIRWALVKLAQAADQFQKVFILKVTHI